VIGREQIAALARECGFGDVADDLAALALPSLRLEYVDAPAEVGASKLGGLPDLPSDVRWPHAKWAGYEQEAMTFFGQIALADLDAAVWPGPREGLLSFFCRQSPDYYGVDVGGAARVLHLPAGAVLDRREPPSTLYEDFRLGECAVSARPEMTLPTIAVDIADVLEPLGFGWDGPRAEQDDDYDALELRLAEAQGFSPRRPDGSWAERHRLLGWPRHIQGDVLLEIVLMHFQDNQIKYKTADLGRLASDWRLLLQIESDRRLGASFGDGGTLFFGMPAAELEAARFDRVQAISQSG
jgi:hypothetical protein